MSILELLLRIKAEGGNVLPKTKADVKDLGTEVAQTDAKLKSFGKADFARGMVASFQQIGKGSISLNDLDRAGRQASIGLTAASSAARLVGADIAGVTMPVASAADSIGAIAGSLKDLSKAQMLVFGGLGVFALAAGVVVQNLQKQHAALAENIKLTDDYLRSMSQFAEGSTEVAASIEKIASTMATAQGMGSRNELVKIFSGFDSARVQLEDFYASLEKGLVRFRSMPEIIAAQKQALDSMTFGARSGYDALEALRASSGHAATAAYEHEKAERARASALEYSVAAAVRLANQLGETRKEAIDGRREDASSLAEYRTQVQWGNMVFKDGVGWVNKYDEALRLKNIADAELAAERLAAAWGRVKDSVRGMIAQQLAIPSFDEHVKRVTEGGKDIWENLFRLDAVATGTSPAEYGAEFEKAFAWLKTIGYDAKTAGAAIRDFTLFLDPKNVQAAFDVGLLDIDGLVAQMEREINSKLGEKNLLDAVFEKVWGGMSGQKKIDLAAALGIDLSGGSADSVKDEIKSKITDPASDASKEVGGIASALQGIPKTVDSVINVLKHADFDKNLDDILDAIAKIPTSIEVAVTMKNGVPSSGGTPNPYSSTGGSGISGAMATGGYADSGKYILGEAGYEFVLPHEIVRYFEKVLGGKIKSPNDLQVFVDSLIAGTGPQAAAEAWAKQHGAGDPPKDFAAWFQRAKVKGAGKRSTVGALLAPPEEDEGAPGGAGAGGGASGAGAGSGLDGNAEVLKLLGSIDGTLHRIERNQVMFGGANTPGVDPVALKQLVNQLIRSMGRRGALRATMGV